MADVNTRISVFLNTFYSITPHRDMAGLIQRYLATEKTGEWTARMKALIADALA